MCDRAGQKEKNQRRAQGARREREHRCRESTRTIIRSRAGSSKDPRDDISMPCLRNNFNYPRYTKKNTKSNARNSSECRPPSAAPLAVPLAHSPSRSLARLLYRHPMQPSSPPCCSLPFPLSLSLHLGGYVPAGPAAMPMDYHGLSCRTSGARARALALVCTPRVTLRVRLSAIVCANAIGNPGGPTYRRGIN